MKQILRVLRSSVATLVFASLAGGVQARELAIQSFDGTGPLTFNTLNNATNYRVEWASSPMGPWTNFTGAAGAWLDSIPRARHLAGRQRHHGGNAGR
jgi:hypothetical protein